MEVIVVVLCILFILYKTCRPFAHRKRKRIIYTSYHRKPEVFRGNVSNFQKKIVMIMVCNQKLKLRIL